MIELSIVVPIHNEGRGIDELLQRISAAVAPLRISYEIVCVDDGSRDDSLVKLHAARERHPELVVVELARNYGQTAALCAGIDESRGRLIQTLDGDLQHRPEEIPKFLEKLGEGYDLVSGWREVRRDNLALRRIPSRAANALMRRVSGVAIQDFGSTFKLYRADLLKQVELFGELHRFIPVLLDRLGARMTEIPIDVAERAHGTSNYGLRRVFGVFQDLLFLEFYANYLTKPMRAFGRLFYCFFGLGFAISLYLLLKWMFGYTERIIDHGALLLFSVFLMIAGIQFLVAGVLAELLTRIYHHTSNRKIYLVKSVSRSAV